MSRTLHEHDYIGLSESPSMENSDNSNNNNNNTGLTLKATELRLGLPGSESPERGTPDKNATLPKGYVSGAKRGFSDALNVGSGKWVFSAAAAGGGGGGGGSNGSEGDVCSKGNGGAALFSPRAGGIGVSAVKDFAPQSPKLVNDKKSQVAAPVAAKEQVVGWPPIRSFRKNSMASQSAKSDDDAESKKGSGCLYVKVSMDGAPYLRKVDLKNYGSYMELSSGLEKMFSCFTIGQCGSHGVPGRDGLSESHLIDLLHGSEYVLTYEDKDRDWMLVGDVPWRMFTETCKRLRIMKSSDAIGLAPRAMEKCKGRD